MADNGGEGDANAGHSCPESSSFSDKAFEAGVVTINGQRLHVVQASAVEQAAIEKFLASGPSATLGPQPKSNWRLAGTRLAGILFLAAAVGTGLGCGLVHHTAQCKEHGTGHCEHKPVPVKASARRSHPGKRRDEDESSAELRTTSDESGQVRQRGECEIRAETCPYRMPDGWCRLTGRRCRLFVGTSEVREFLAGLHGKFDAVRKDLSEARGAAVAVPEDVAQQVFAVVREMETGGRWRKAPMLRVFRLYCQEGMTANQVAKECACSKALVVLRLKQLRLKLGRDPAELRTLSSQFEAIEDSLSDSRARGIHREGLEDG